MRGGLLGGARGVKRAPLLAPAIPFCDGRGIMSHHLSVKSTSQLKAEALEEVRAVYTDLAARPVERACIRRTECCQFKLTGQTPVLTKGEAMIAALGLRAAGRTKLPTPAVPGACPMLDPRGKCIIYSSRPFGCRTHFCEAAGGPYSRREVLDLIRRLELVDEKLKGVGSLSLPSAMEMAMADYPTRREG